MTTKADHTAAVRLLNKAVSIAIADLKIAGTSRRADVYQHVYGKNIVRFATAIEAAALLVKDPVPQPREDQQC